MLWGPDYDGTHKAWVRFADGDEIVGGSRVTRRLAAAPNAPDRHPAARPQRDARTQLGTVAGDEP